MKAIFPQLAHAMALTLEATESDIDRVLALLRVPPDRDMSLAVAGQLLVRTKVRVQTVRLALHEAHERG